MPSRRTCAKCGEMCSLRYDAYVTMSFNPVFGQASVPDAHVHAKCLPPEVSVYVFKTLKIEKS